ncbi:metal ABC transporter permease [Lyngbya confervoides]|uniref:Metal ABC transporter permease n=1 Tax=Lyngbya confervoides BDU141951 TaxID=1574623 RepID=A0ABD4T1N1_9CYAN|nr:metal ABC transporter permease [Lyngbya confervoides]MCM1982350.1 metal ABC transporter permease [Lyngbya confervoides BDU141951]
MLTWILEPLNYEFMRHAIAMGVIVGILCPVLGSLLIVQQMALLGDVVAHCVLPGLSISVFAGLNPMVGAFLSGITGAFFISWIRDQSRIKADSAMALTFSSYFALGVLLISLLKNAVDLDALLFGEILGVTSADLGRTGVIAGIVLLAVKLLYKELLLFCFDRTGAQAMGLPVTAIYYGLMAATTLTIIASMQAVGVVLVIALMVAPALSAYLFVDELHHMMILGSGVGTVTTTLGIYLSYRLNLPSGPAIVLVSTLLFLLLLLVKLWRDKITLMRP